MDPRDAMRPEADTLENEERFPIFPPKAVDTTGYGDIIESAINAQITAESSVRSECALVHGTLVIDPRIPRFSAREVLSLDKSVETLRIAFYAVYRGIVKLFPTVELSPPLPYEQLYPAHEEILQRALWSAGLILRTVRRVVPLPPLESTLQRAEEEIVLENCRRVYAATRAALGALRAALERQENTVIASIAHHAEHREMKRELRRCSHIVLSNGGSVTLFAGVEEVRVEFTAVSFPESEERIAICPPDFDSGVDPVQLCIPGLRLTYIGRNRFLFIEASDPYIPVETSLSRCGGPTGVVWEDESGE